MFFTAIEDKHTRSKVERLYYNYRNLMFSVAYNVLGDKEQAEDAVAESLVRIMKSIGKVDEENVPKTRSFLVIICRNVAINMYKERNKFIYNDAYYDSASEDTQELDPLDIVVSREEFSRVSKAIESLEPIYRDVFLLRYAHEYSREEIAACFGISLEAVKKRLLRAKKQVLEKLSKECAE